MMTANTLTNIIASTAHTVTTILQEICRKGSEFDQIIDNLIAPNYKQKPELISELALSFYSNEGSIDQAIKKNYFKYFFIRTVKNQVHSKTSPFHKNCRMTIVDQLNCSDSDLLNEIDDDADINKKLEIEEKIDVVEEALNKTNVTYFEAELFKLYFFKDYTYRQIEKECDVDHVLAWLTVKKVLNKVKKQIKRKNIYN